LTTLKIAVVAPIPRASVAAVTTKKPGARAIERAANRRSRRRFSIAITGDPLAALGFCQALRNNLLMVF
jgi:hypothetical protein